MAEKVDAGDAVRALLDAVRQEREACAALMDDWEREYRALANHRGPEDVEADAMARAFKKAARLIRARR